VNISYINKLMGLFNKRINGIRIHAIYVQTIVVGVETRAKRPSVVECVAVVAESVARMASGKADVKLAVSVLSL